MAFSTDAATSAFLTTYGAGLRGMISSTVEGNAATVAERMGSLWAQTHIELDKLEGIERHVPEEGRLSSSTLSIPVYFSHLSLGCAALSNLRCAPLCAAQIFSL